MFVYRRKIDGSEVLEIDLHLMDKSRLEDEIGGYVNVPKTLLAEALADLHSMACVTYVVDKDEEGAAYLTMELDRVVLLAQATRLLDESGEKALAEWLNAKNRAIKARTRDPHTRSRCAAETVKWLQSHEPTTTLARRTVRCQVSEDYPFGSPRKKPPCESPSSEDEDGMTREEARIRLNELLDKVDKLRGQAHTIPQILLALLTAPAWAAHTIWGRIKYLIRRRRRR
jgi:hypothetical protein